jgi:stearoyl-CoA desaturase (delta-9 desaturase)
MASESPNAGSLVSDAPLGGASAPDQVEVATLPPSASIAAHLETSSWHATNIQTPRGTQPQRILWTYVIGIVGIHLLALLALVPALFSWTGVAMAIAGCYVFGTLGINLCYHRLLTHRSFDCPPALEHFFALLGICCLQDSPVKWVVCHRLHHQYSDEQPDPHSPLVRFFWGHVGWLLVANREISNINTYDRYARDLLRDPFYFGMERKFRWVQIYVAHWLVFFLGGLGFGLLAGWGLSASLWFGSSLLVWGVFVRTVLVWHITWSVNSVTHVWGYRNYETDENSRNNWLVGLVSNGEGWHNNHHADQRSAAHGHLWWEFDVTYLTIRLLARLGLARNVVQPSAKHLCRVS